ncbi:MAG: VWA domain-containing protein [Acidobacteria bacterium]|nr:VWA domain-containing protein [Acidobacteriota bacterium]
MSLTIMRTPSRWKGALLLMGALLLKRPLLLMLLALLMLIPFSLPQPGTAQNSVPQVVLNSADELSNGAVFRVEVDMVLLNIAVTDSKGNYVTGLKPWDFTVSEDGLAQKVATFAEGNESPRDLGEFTPSESVVQIVKPDKARVGTRLRDDSPAGVFPEDETERISQLVSGASVYILFDTSNYMYEGFVYAQDAIADFVRSLDNPDRVALYSYSRDFSRHATLTSDRGLVLRGLRSTIVGDDAALYNAMLLTLKDAARSSGRKVLVAFSNGPDDASMVAPEDVREFAQAEGISIYMVSTREARHDPVSTAVFQRISDTTGGKAYFAKDWKAQQDAFASIRSDLSHLYSVSYYPSQNPNRGWRDITVKLSGDHLKKYKIRARTGYRPRPARMGG